MAEGKVRSPPWIVRIIFLGSIGIVLFAVLLLAVVRSSTSAENLYVTAIGLRHEKIAARRDAAKMLAKHPDGDPWIVLLFLSSQTAKPGDEYEQRRQKALHPFELGVVAAALDALPEDVGAPVLWAITFLLNDEERGQWCEERGFILTKKVLCGSRPIRELARNCLKVRIGVDHGWNASAWRVAITKRKMHEGVKQTSNTAAESQPEKTDNP